MGHGHLGDLAIKDLELVKKVFDKHGVRLFVVYGVLLGFYRDKGFLPGDDDIDLAVVDPVDYKTRKDIGWELYALGFEPQNVGFNVFQRMEPAEIGYNGDEETGIMVNQHSRKFTIFFFKEEECPTHGHEYVCIPKLGALRLISTPKKFFEKASKIRINGKDYLAPSPIEDYLAYSYKDWKDKNLRDHSPTYFSCHPEAIEKLNIDGKNEVIFYGGETPS